MFKTGLASLIVAFFALFGFSPAQAVGGPTLTVSSAYSDTWTGQTYRNAPVFTATGFAGPVTFSTSPALPAGLVMDSATGTISGTATVPQFRTAYVVSATDGVSTATTTLNIGITEILNHTKNSITVPVSAPINDQIVINFSKGSLLTSATGGISIPMQGFTVNNPSGCNGFTLNVPTTSCTLDTSGSMPILTFEGVDFSGANPSFIFTVAAGTLSTPASGWVCLNLNQNNGPNTASIAVTSPCWGVGSAPQVNNNQPQAAVASIDLSAAIGQPVAGASAPYSASGLLGGSSYDVVVRSTPQVIDQGVVPNNGTISGNAVIPAGLEPGWHTITFTTTAADGTETKDVIWFKIAADGTLLSKADSQPAELAITGAVTTSGIPLAIIVLLMGFAAFFVAREINPDFVRVMSLVRGPDGQLDFVKRRIRSEEL